MHMNAQLQAGGSYRLVPLYEVIGKDCQHIRRPVYPLGLLIRTPVDFINTGTPSNCAGNARNKMNALEITLSK